MGRKLAVFEYMGGEVTYQEIADLAGISKQKVISRIVSGWSVEEIISGEKITLSAGIVKRLESRKGRGKGKFAIFATCEYRVNAK